MRFILKTIIVALAILGVSYFFYGIEVKSFTAALLFSIVLGLLNVFVKPITKLVSLPINILTFGLFSLVINVFFFWLAAQFIDGIQIKTFLSLIFSAMVISVVSSMANTFLRKKKDKKED